jgi:2-polyprenyl-3-methyl-5-hydroxy-6-metoxy-1,4-benzoquinol methylase
MNTTPPWRNEKAKVRKQFLASVADYKSAEILEIGAFASPTLTKAEARVTYLDRRSTEDLRASVADESKRNAVVPVDVLQAGAKLPSDLHGRFDIVIANHVVEHVPNLVAWLAEVRDVLRPGGFLVMAVPDREYTFDKLRELTTLREVLADFFEERTSPSLAKIVDQQYFWRAIHTGGQVWSGAHVNVLNAKKYETLNEAITHARHLMSGSKYVDCHCNVFTHESFVRIVNELAEGGLVGFSISSSKPPQRPYNEFYVALKNQQTSAATK